MTKRRKETAKTEKSKTNILNGKIVKTKKSEMPSETPSKRKAQVKLHRTPLRMGRSKQTTLVNKSPITDTPFLDKCTSTPMNMVATGGDEFRKTRNGRILRPNNKYKDVNTAFSPILADIGNLGEKRCKKIKDFNQCVDENQNVERSMVAESQENKNQSKVAPTIRKSLIPDLIGAKEVAFLRTTKRRSVGIRRVVAVSSQGDTTRRRKASEMVPEPDADHSLVKRLKADWTSTTIREIPTQFRSPQRVRQRPVKRRLTPLGEITVDESTISATKPTVEAAKPTEEVYSSSAEFESEDEKENNHSKRAPTWKDLTNKTTPKVRVRRSKILSKSQKEQRTAGLTPKVRVRRTRLDLKMPAFSPRRESSTVVATEIESAFNGTTPKVRLRRCRIFPKDQKSNEIEGDVPVPLDKENSKKNDCSSVPRTSGAADEVGIRNDSASPVKDANAVNPISPSSGSGNLLNKSDLIEQILSSSVDDDQENIPVDHHQQTNANTNTTKKFFHSRIDATTPVVPSKEPVKVRKSNSRRTKRDNVYEFLSQSSSDAADPVADIIQKMIKTGKVAVAKHMKKTGKPRIKQAKRKRTAKKIVDKAEEDVFAKPRILPKRKPLQEKVVNTVHFDDDVHFDDGGSEEFFEEEPNRDQRGFSELARSAMIKQAAVKNESTPTQRKMITDRKRLIEMAQKIVGGQSPSVVRASASPSTAPRLSPILGSRSPWRVDDDKLPSLFYFSRNSDNLPSFSSDYIPSTPMKNKSASKSSFSSNDSDMENIAPPGAKVPLTGHQNQNARRALSYRSPLKPINILEVITLPPMAIDSTAKDSSTDTTRKDKSALNNTSKVNNTSKANSEMNKETTRKDKSDSNNTSMFGFEELIDDEDDDLTSVTLDNSVIPHGQDLKTKLQRLKRLRPQKPVATTSKNARIKAVFDERPKQKTLQQMLCSTMIEKQRQSEKANDGDDQHERYFNDGSDTDLSNLFKDPEPQTTFDESHSRRTYSRPFRKKRKLRNNFVMFMDSDASEDEEEEKLREKKAKKLQKKDPKENAELNKFVDEFNEMCKEVSQYELMVE